MVRLKAVAKVYQRANCKFQFLMVRLKETPMRNLLLSGNVSIPYGTIKRNDALSVAAPRRKVSIPYGTIKRMTAEGLQRIFEVSIPYGTIKSLKIQKDNPLALINLRHYKDTKIKCIKCRYSII